MKSRPVEIGQEQVEKIVKVYFEHVKRGWCDIPTAISDMAYEILKKQFPDIPGKTKYRSPSFPQQTFDSLALAIWNDHTSPYPLAALWLAYFTMTNTLKLAKTIPNT